MEGESFKHKSQVSVTHRLGKTYASLTNSQHRRLTMANQDIDTFHKLLNRLDNELTASAKSMSEVLGKILLMKSTLETLRENQVAFTKLR